MPEQERHTCMWCDVEEAEGESFHAYNGYDSSGNHNAGFLCPDCYESTELCGDCGERWPSDEIYRTDWDTTYCPDCRDESFFTCEGCGALTPNGDEMRLGNTSLCESCMDEYISDGRAVTCESCGRREWSDNTDMRWIEDREVYLCQWCLIHTRHAECVECYNLFTHNISVFINEDGDEEWLCNHCANNVGYSPEEGEPIDGSSPGQGRGSIYHIQSYNFKPEPDFRAMPKERLKMAKLLFMGMELEMQVVRGDRQDMMDARRFLAEEDRERLFYLKRDGSIGYGFELVTHPFSWAWMKANPQAFEPIFELSKWCDAHDNGACGMHVHMSKAGFTKLHLYKFAKFLFAHPDFAFRISRRTAEAFNSWSPASPGADIKSLAMGRRGGNRGMLNFGPRDTVEYRAFNGTISRAGVYGNLEYLKSVYDFTKHASIHQVELDEYLKFLEKGGYKYGKLLAASVSGSGIELET